MIWFIYFIIWLFKIFFDTMWWRPHLLVFPKKHLLSGDHGERYSLPCFSKFKICQLFYSSWYKKVFFLSMFFGWWDENTSFQYILSCVIKKEKTQEWKTPARFEFIIFWRTLEKDPWCFRGFGILRSFWWSSNLSA